MQDSYQDFRERGAEIIVVTASSLTAVERIERVMKVPFPILADVDHQVVEAYGVYDPTEDDEVSPALFIVDSDREIAWSYVGAYPADRPGAQEILGHLP